MELVYTNFYSSNWTICVRDVLGAAPLTFTAHVAQVLYIHMVIHI